VFTGRSRRWKWSGIVVLGALIGAALWSPDTPGQPGKQKPLDRAEVARIAGATTDKAIDDLNKAPARSAKVYDAILPSIVVVQRRSSIPGRSGLGTAVVIDDKGTMLTSLHVVDGSDTLDLTFADGTQSTGRITSSDPANDIAVLAADRLPEVIVPAVLGGGVHVGDEVMAVGHPLGFVASMSAGVVSGLDRSVPVEPGRTLTHLIQFDAAVNPGNSGGPLLDRDGRVVGVVAALVNLGNPSNPPANAAPEGSFIGIGFAVPIGTAGGAAGAPPR
jgi:S1-C subfamily serine protease